MSTLSKSDDSLRSTRLVFYKEDIELIGKNLNTFLKNANGRCVNPNLSGEPTHTQDDQRYDGSARRQSDATKYESDEPIGRHELIRKCAEHKLD